MPAHISLAEDAESIRAAYSVMHQLRLHLEEEEFVERVLRQQKAGYRLATLRQNPDGPVEAVAGFRVLENLAWSRLLYVDDLVTSEQSRSCGYGQILLDWLAETARDEGCQELHLDSGVQRFAAHRFYLRAGFDITGHHFARKLS